MNDRIGVQQRFSSQYNGTNPGVARDVIFTRASRTDHSLVGRSRIQVSRPSVDLLPRYHDVTAGEVERGQCEEFGALAFAHR